MNFTAREDYGLRAVLDLAVHAEQGPIQSREIAARQNIPEQFLEQLLGALRRAGIVRSVRGASGGYLLNGSAASVSVGDVLRALSGALVPVECIAPGGQKTCGHSASRGVHVFWERVSEAISDVADGLTFADLIDIQMASDSHAAFMMNI